MPEGREAVARPEIPAGATIRDDGTVTNEDGVVLGKIEGTEFVPDAGAIDAVGNNTINTAVGQVAQGEVARSGLEDANAKAGIIDSDRAGVMGIDQSAFSEWYSGPGFFEQVPNWIEVGGATVVAAFLTTSLVKLFWGSAKRNASGAVSRVRSRVGV